MDSNQKQTDWELLARYATGEASAEEEARAKQWLDAHPDDARLLGLVDKTAPGMAPAPLSDFEVESALRQVQNRMTPPASQAPRLPGTRHRWLAAAAVIAALGLWTLLRSREHTDQLPHLAAQAATTSRQLDTLLLDDGSRVILAPNSEVTVTGRTASMRGRAWFDIAHDEARPFTVRTEHAIMRDLGTAFDVIESADGRVVVEVTEGIVEMRAVRNGNRAGVVLHAGDRGRLSAGGPPAAERGVVAGAPAWTGGRLVFENANMTEVQDGLRRWYGIDLQVHDTALAGRHVTAAFASEPVDQVLRIIALALGGTIERRGNTAILHTTPSTSAR